MAETGCTDCGHNMSAHTADLCSIADCYCGRDPLRDAIRTRCGWCSTGDPVVWVRTVNGKRMMVEPEPNPAGNCSIHYSQGVPIVTVHKQPPGMLDDWTPYMPHIATCDQRLKPLPRK